MLPPRYTLNRHLVLLVHKQPFLDWLLSVDQAPQENPPLTLAGINDDNEAFLIPDDVAETTADAVKWVEKNWRMFFEHVLGGWITEPDLWPKISLKMFREWFDVQYCSMAWDLADEPLLSEDWADEEADEDPTVH